MKLKNSVVVFDLETTGTWVEKDRIVEIALIKCLPDGTQEKYLERVNPRIPIPPKVSELIGITNEDVKDKPWFKDIAAEILRFIGESDFGGFNCERFDLPFLERELGEAGFPFDWRKKTVYDCQKIFHIHEKRDLTAGYKFYCKKELVNAHSAMADTEATLEILEAQIKMYGDEEGSLESMKDFDYQSPMEFFDKEKRFGWWNGELYLMFGKHARKSSLKDLVEKDKGYLEWICRSDFSDSIKNTIRDALKGKFPEQVQQERVS